MINNATFQIIGRIGSIKATDKVTRVNVASGRQVKDKDGNWSTEANWNSITIFNEALRKRLANEKVGRPGNLVILESAAKCGADPKKANLQLKNFRGRIHVRPVPSKDALSNCPTLCGTLAHKG